MEEHPLVTLHIEELADDKLKISGKVNSPKQYATMEVFAAAPLDRMMNYAGSGLPFPCSDIAFENTPNRFSVPKDGTIETSFVRPNSYYNVFHEKIPPTVFVKLTKAGVPEPIFVKFGLTDKLPLRTLFYRNATHHAPDFYQRRADILGVKSQEAIIRELEKVKAEGKTG